MIGSRALILSLAVASLVACKKADDPLEPFRKQCLDLKTSGSLKAGLSTDDCATQLKASFELNDPTKRAEELATRMQAVSTQAAGKSTQEAQGAADELRGLISELQILGKPAASIVQAHFEASRDPDLRIAYARALVGLCFDDCATQKYGCIVPALMEGLGMDKPPEARQVAVAGLARCTGKNLGEDPAAWTTWWASVKDKH
jgi:hypothetical protein